LNNSLKPSLYLALIHYPVVNKKSEVIASAVTNLDLHDISRAARTFGAKAFFVVTPLTDQQAICRSIIRHWVDGWGAKVNPDRKDALAMIRIRDSLDDVKREIAHLEGKAPKTVATGARVGSLGKSKEIRFNDLRRMLMEHQPWLLLFGTAWGLASSVTGESDHILEPVTGPENYNHLSVRSAASVILDRLLGRQSE